MFLTVASPKAPAVKTLLASFGRGVLSCALLLLREFGLGDKSIHAAQHQRTPGFRPESKSFQRFWKSMKGLKELLEKHSRQLQVSEASASSFLF